MGLNRRHIAFLAASRRLGAAYEHTLTIGRQTMWADGSIVSSALAEGGLEVAPADAERIVATSGGFGETLLRQLGATELDSVDASDYEGSSIVHDFNDPLPDELRGRYSVVLESGTLEHVFNFPQALRNCLEAVAVGGHFITMTPTNNELGHGFYQFSPELYHRVLSPQNGFEVRCMLVRAERRLARWYEVADPADIRRRITLSGAFPCYLYVLAERVAKCDPLGVVPQQSDYVVMWSEDGQDLKPRVRRIPDIPLPAKQAWEWLRLLLDRPSETGLTPVRLDQLRPRPGGSITGSASRAASPLGE